MRSGAKARAVLILVLNATSEKRPLPEDRYRAMLARDLDAREGGRSERTP
jgi:hypothetical protein